MKEIKLDTNGFVTFEVIYEGKSHGFTTWCPVCQKGFETGAKNCPHCGTPVPKEERKKAQ